MQFPIQRVPGTRWLECVMCQAQGLLYRTLNLYTSNHRETRWSGNTACVLEVPSLNLGWYSDYLKQGFCGFSHFLWEKEVKAKLSLFKSCGHIRRPEVQLHSLTLALDGNEWSIRCASCFTASKINSWYPQNRRLDILEKRKIPGCSFCTAVTILTMLFAFRQMPGRCRNGHSVQLSWVKSNLPMQLQYFIYKCSMVLLWTVLLCHCQFTLMSLGNVLINQESGINSQQGKISLSSPKYPDQLPVPASLLLNGY